MATRRRVVALAMIALVLGSASLLAWATVWRPMIVMHRVGLGGLMPESGRRCEEAPGMPWRHCYRRQPPTSPNSGEEEAISLIRSTRQVTLAERSWQAPDSASSFHRRDSISLALDRWGGARIPCPPPSGSGELRALTAWRFDEQDVKLMTEQLPGAYGHPPVWIVDVGSYPVGFSGCESTIHVRRLLTPAELGEKVRQWMEDLSE